MNLSHVTPLKARLFYSDIKAETAENGSAALKYLHHNAKDVSAILLELTLSDTDAFSVLKSIQELELSANIPVIVVSGTAERDAVLSVPSLWRA